MGIIATNVYSLAIVKDGENGTSSYMFTRYSSTEAPHSDMYEVPVDDTIYIGTYISSINTPSTNPADYNWVRYRSEDSLSVKINANNGTEFCNNDTIISLTAITKKGKANVTGTYKWYKDGNVISGATSSTYTLSCTGLSIYTIFKCEATYKEETVSDSITIQNNVSILYGDTNPYLRDTKIYAGSIWINTSTDPNTYYRYDGSNWIKITQQQYYNYVGYGQGKTTEFFTTKIKETADDITLIADRVSITENTIEENYSELKQTADSIKTEVTNVRTDFDNMEIGGRNLLSNSSFDGLTGNNLYTFNEDVVTFSRESLDTTVDSSSFRLNLVPYSYTNIQNKQLTISMDYCIDKELAFGTGDPWVGIQLAVSYDGSSSSYLSWYGNKTIPTSVMNGWKRYSTTVKVKDATVTGGYIGIYFRETTGTIRFRHPKIEIGNKATDWTVAPEDTESSISSMYSKIEQNADKISWMVKSGTSASNMELTDECLNVIAENINLTGKVTFSSLDSSTQKKINDAQSTAESASNTANEAQSIASSIKSTADIAKSTADTAKDTAENAKSTADSANNWIDSNGTNLTDMRNMVLKWTNNAVSTTTRINGGWIDTNTITAEKIAIGDFTNYVTVNESNSKTAITSNHPFGTDGNTIISNGYISKNTAISQYIALSNYCVNSFEDNDELYYSFTIKGASTGTCTIGVWFYGDGLADDLTYKIERVGSSHSFTTSDTVFTGTIKLSTCKTYSYYAIGVRDTTSTKAQIYIKNASVRKKNGGNLIVDGTITAAKIAASTITSDKLKVGIGGNLYATGYDTFDQITGSSLYYSKSANLTATITTETAYYGSKSLKLVSGGTDTYIYLGYLGNGYGCIPVTTGQIYRISCYAKSDSNSSALLHVIGHTAKNTTNSTDNSTTKTIGTSWTRIEFSYTAISGYPYISIRIDNNTSGTTLYVDAIQIEEVSSTSQLAGSFRSAGTTVIDGGNIVTKTITADSIDVDQLSAITANIGNLIVDGYLTTNTSRTSYNQAVTGLTLDKNGIGGWGSSSKYFNLSKDGQLTCAGAVITGQITATSGAIGGWNITTNYIYNSQNGGSIYITSKSDSSTYWIRTHDAANGGGNMTFSVSKTGKLYATGAEISGKITATEGKIGNWTIGTALYSSSGGSALSSTTSNTAYIGTDGLNFYKSSSAYFKVTTSTGILSATGANISGTITATGGKIGNWTIGTALYYASGGSNLSSTTANTAYIGTDGLNFYQSSSAYFKVTTSTGVLQCAGANISGTITATGGAIGGWNLSSTCIYNSQNGGSIYITSKNDNSTYWIRTHDAADGGGNITFSVSKTGKLYATGAEISGKITATGGTVGGWSINADKIYSGDGTTKVAVVQKPTDNTTYVFAAGGTSHSSYSDCPFRVTKDGKLYASRLYVTGDASTSSGEGFYIYDPMNEKYLLLADCNGGIRFPAFSYTFTGLLEINKLASGIKVDTADVYDLGDGTNHFRTLYARSLRIGCESYLTDNGAIFTRWKDGSPHDILVRSSDGLTCSVGWAGTSSYKSVTQIRGQTVKYTNSSGTTTLSDVRMKKDFTDLSAWEEFYANAEPCAFKYINGASGRYHVGFKAQQIQEALESSGLTTQDFAGLIQYDVDPLSDDWHGYETEYGLIYTEFIALNTYMIQKLISRVNELEAKLNALS